MKTAIIIFMFLCLGCSTVPDNTEAWVTFHKNACLPTAIIYKKILQKQDIWSKVMVYKVDNQPIGHAVTVFLYPPGKNQLWTYDWEGAYRVRAYKDATYEIAKQTEKERYRSGDQISYAYYID